MYNMANILWCFLSNLELDVSVSEWEGSAWTFYKISYIFVPIMKVIHFMIH